MMPMECKGTQEQWYAIRYLARLIGTPFGPLFPAQPCPFVAITEHLHHLIPRYRAIQPDVLFPLQQSTLTLQTCWARGDMKEDVKGG
jgi:hypothetical protein